MLYLGDHHAFAVVRKAQERDDTMRRWVIHQILCHFRLGSRELGILHGRFDPMIPMEYGRLSADRLIEAGFEVEWHDYPMAHAVCPDEIVDIRQWLLSVYAA